MTTAIIGVGNIGKSVARHLVDGGERVVLAARDESNATAPANQLGELASATSVEKAITDADVVVFAVWLDTLKDLIAQHADLLRGKVVLDPSNPVAQDTNGGFVRTLPDGQSSGSVVAGLLPAEAHFVKAFGTLGAESLASQANRTPRAVLFYATDDDQAAAASERLISAAGFEPVTAGGVEPPCASRHSAPCTSSEDSTGRWSTPARRAPPSRQPHDGPAAPARSVEHMAHKQMAERRADDRQPDTIAKPWIDGRWRDAPQHRDSVDPATGEVIGRYAAGEREAASKDRTTAEDRPHEPSGEIAGDACGALIADQHA